MAEPAPERRGRLPRSVRARATVGAVLVIGVALVVSAAALLVVLRGSYVESVRNPARARAADIAASLDDGTPADRLELEEGHDRFVQIVAGDRVEAGSANAAALPSLAATEGTGVSTPVADVDDQWVVVTAATGSGRTVVVGRELDPPVESVADALSALAVGLPLLLAVGGVTTWRVVGAALGPVEAIRSEVSSLGGAELTRRVPVPTTGDEIEQLARTMNGMLDRLQAAQRQQHRFVSDASHELRSPLAAIRQHAEVARLHPERAPVGELAEVVLAEEAHLERIVEDLLLLARSDEGGLGLRFAPVALHDVVRQEAGRVDGSRLAVDTSTVEPVLVTGDEATLRRAVRNLIDNAARHASTTIRIETTSGPNHATLTVHDDGPGIPVPVRDTVLERFTRLDDARSADDGGAGLGLAIVAEVAAAHDGDVTVGDSPLGGAAVTMRLPWGRSHRAAATGNPAELSDRSRSDRGDGERPARGRGRTPGS